MNVAEYKDLKVKLSRKDKDLRELQEHLDAASQKILAREADLARVLEERDVLRLKNEVLAECLQQHDLPVEDCAPVGLPLLAEYKEKLGRAELALEQRERELQERGKQLAELQLQS